MTDTTTILSVTTPNLDPGLAILNLWALSCSGILPTWERTWFPESLLKRHIPNVWQKPLQYCKVISRQLIKINEKKLKETKKEDTFPFGANEPWFGSKVTPCWRYRRLSRPMGLKEAFTPRHIFALLLLLEGQGQDSPLPSSSEEPTHRPPFLSDAASLRSLGNSRKSRFLSFLLCPYCIRTSWAWSLTSQILSIGWTSSQDWEWAMRVKTLKKIEIFK